MRTTMRLLILIAVWAVGVPAAAQQTILVQEDFESGVLGPGWDHWQGGANPSCSEVHFTDVGLNGTSAVMASNTPNCDQATGLEYGPVDISGCSTISFYGLFMDVGDETDSCPAFWFYWEPPEGDCVGVSFDGFTYFLFTELTGYTEYTASPVYLDYSGPLLGNSLWVYFSENDDDPPMDDGIAFDDITVVCDPEEVVCDDGIDNDFDGDIDCDDLDCDGIDGDGDGAELCDGDCDDTDADTYPGAPEICDGLDNNCNGAVPADEVDADGDGFWACGGDCDDTDPFTNPNAAEVCDGEDNNCNGVIPTDEQDNNGNGIIDCLEGCADDDGDGVTVCDGDCNDADDTVYPGAPEICDGLDNNCNGVVPGDELDHDGDG